MSSIDRILEPSPDLRASVKNGSAGESFEPSRGRSDKLASCAAGILIVLFCLYRIASFTPQPLDSAQTLRPLLYRWFINFLSFHAHPEQAFEHWSSLCFLALLVPPALALFNFALPSLQTKLPLWISRFLRSRWALFASVGVCSFFAATPSC